MESHYATESVRKNAAFLALVHLSGVIVQLDKFNCINIWEFRNQYIRVVPINVLKNISKIWVWHVNAETENIVKYLNNKQ